MEFILDRDSSGNWVDVKDNVLLGFPSSDARSVAKYIQKNFPDALVGIKSSVLGPASVWLFGEVAWLNKL